MVCIGGYWVMRATDQHLGCQTLPLCNVPAATFSVLNGPGCQPGVYLVCQKVLYSARGVCTWFASGCLQAHKLLPCEAQTFYHTP